MSFDPDLAEIRFGCGLSPVLAPAKSTKAILAALSGPDDMAARFPIESFETFQGRMLERARQSAIRRKDRGSPASRAATKAIRRLNQTARIDAAGWFGQTLMRRTWTEDGLRERLAHFWGDHFTARGKTGVLRRATSPYIEDAIRPHLTGRFEELLIAAVKHPLFLHYLDQQNSVGPNSAVATRRKKNTGLNENLAREVLELHTLGVDGPYTQQDVRQLAELFTGLTFQIRTGFKFNKHFAEPGAETVLGKEYGGDPARLRDVHAALRDLARHPATARHLCWKLAVHFVSDTPTEALVVAMTRRYDDSRGDLMQVYETLLNHPDAWVPAGNIKQPIDFVSSACRALAVAPELIAGFDERALQLNIIQPMGLMGQIWERPEGPDGWPEEDRQWVTPQGIAARLQWAVAVPQVLRPDLPDPRDFVRTALGTRSSAATAFAAKAAESRADGIGLILASPAFQRQ